VTAALRKRFDRLEASRRALLDSVAELDEEPLRRQPGEGRWSIIQVLGHLTLAEEATLAYLHKKMQDPSNVPAAGLTSLARLAVVAAVLRSPLRRKAPARTADPPASRSLSEAREHWDRVRADWAAFLQSFPPDLLGRAVFRHPFVGRMSIAHTLGFMNEHLRHHAKQIERIRSALGAGP